MPVYYLPYDLHEEGYIDNWLLAGPQALPVPDLERFGHEDFKLQIARHYYQEHSGITQSPQEWDPPFSIGDETFRWRYVRCLDDHFIDLSAFYRTCHYLRAWAYAEARCRRAQEVTFLLTTHGPADVWLNGQHLHRQEHFHRQAPHSVPFQGSLQEGHNKVLVRFEEVAMRECPYAMALQTIGLRSEGVLVMLPTPMEAIARRQTLERVIEAAYLDRYVYTRNDEVIVRWPDDLGVAATLCLRFQDQRGRISVEAYPTAKASDSQALLKGFQAADGSYQVAVMPHPGEYYEDNQRVQKSINLEIVKNPHSQTPYGVYEERCREALADAANRSDNVFAEIAKMEMGRWRRVETDIIMETIEGINQRRDCSDFYMTGLLGMMYRYLDDPAFPPELKDPLEKCVLNFKYWMDEPGSDAMCYWSENHQILFHTCEILAGQLYPDLTFTNSGQSGQWHRQKGERMALSWLRKRGTGGFREWDSNCYFEQDLLALSHLVDLAENPEVWELAAMVMDKMLFTMALNSYQGVFGSTHGRTYAPLVKSGRLEATAGFSRLMWGLGVFNNHIMGTVSLACARRYGLPAVIERIAPHLPEEMWNRERHAGELEEWCDRATGSWEVNKVTYKTPDYMLCSAQDYHPGEKGYQQHIWQATMGPDAVVFVTHPPCISEENSRRPNFWQGNYILPRVAQWQDVLIAIYNPSSGLAAKPAEGDWLGFTHAYFPIQAFDEHLLRDGWAFARKGDGYLGLTAAQGLTLIKQGQSAYRELRSYGLPNVWLCHMGRAARDQSFGQFQERVLRLDVLFDELKVNCQTLGGGTLAFGWEGPLMVNGKEQPISGFKHYDNPYCAADWPASRMEIRFADQSLTLDFSESQGVG